jgi:hypothetical protein
MARRVRNIDTRYLFLALLIFVLVLTFPRDLTQYLTQESVPLTFSTLASNSQTAESIFFSNDNDTQSIRRWGCHQTETPLIFVHIGKSGGGRVRARFAAAAQNYSRSEWHSPSHDNHYYPISSSSSGTDVVGRARYCNSGNHNFRIPNTTIQSKSFEGTTACNATTPIGMAIACPQLSRNPGGGNCDGCRNMGAEECHTVSMGHTFMGNELHWLPAPYLKKWWNTHWSSSSRTFTSTTKTIDQGFQSLLPGDTRWCPEYGQARPRPVVGTKRRKGNEAAYLESVNYWNCSLLSASRMDLDFLQFWRTKTTKTTNMNNNDNNNYAPIYASLPLHRVVLLREPYSWLVSRFQWNREYRHTVVCDDIRKSSKRGRTFDDSGWAYKLCLLHLLYLCGEDCASRYEYGMISLPEMEAQAESNLRQAFSVVGLLNETDAFYDMVTTRIAYVNMSLNPQVKGSRHPSLKTTESMRCSRVFQNEKFQQLFKEKLPILASLERLYQVGVEVNRFQQEELQHCHG